MISDDEIREEIFVNDKITVTSCPDESKFDKTLPVDFNVSDKNLNIYTQAPGMGSLNLKNETNVYEENLNKINLKTCSQGSMNILCPWKRRIKI